MNHEFTRSTRNKSLNPEHSECRLKADVEKKKRTGPCEYHFLHDNITLSFQERNCSKHKQHDNELQKRGTAKTYKKLPRKATLTQSELQ